VARPCGTPFPSRVPPILRAITKMQVFKNIVRSCGKRIEPRPHGSQAREGFGAADDLRESALLRNRPTAVSGSHVAKGHKETHALQQCALFARGWNGCPLRRALTGNRRPLTLLTMTNSSIELPPPPKPLRRSLSRRELENGDKPHHRSNPLCAKVSFSKPRSERFKPPL
jgi:hypothetical protein